MATVPSVLGNRDDFRQNLYFFTDLLRIDGGDTAISKGQKNSTVWKIGYFYSKKAHEQKIIGIQTDFRRTVESEGSVVNAMIEKACDRIVRTREELMEVICHIFWLRGENPCLSCRKPYALKAEHRSGRDNSGHETPVGRIDSFSMAEGKITDALTILSLYRVHACLQSSIKFQ